jgi:prophage antirepressor-like protein
VSEAVRPQVELALAAAKMWLLGKDVAHALAHSSVSW